MEEHNLGIFVCLQFYLGTTRLQLEHKGDSEHVVTNIANVVPAFGFIGIPIIAWLLDKKGYGITLGTINFLGVIASIFQAMPSLYFQVGGLAGMCFSSRARPQNDADGLPMKQPVQACSAVFQLFVLCSALLCHVSVTCVCWNSFPVCSFIQAAPTFCL
jgi:hypothetical protein